MTRIIVNPAVLSGGRKRNRKGRRLLYLALIARQMGYDVALDKARQRHFPRHPQLQAIIRELPPARGIKRDDVYLASDRVLQTYEPTARRVVAFKEAFDCSRDAALCKRVAVLVAYVWSRECFTVQANRRQRPRTKVARVVRDKVMSVPWRPFETTTETIHDDGMLDAFLRDDLAAIRAAYGVASKSREIGFIGCAEHLHNVRKSLCHESYSVLWAGGGRPKLSSADYLAWLSGCKAVLNLPGDTWKCSRFLESVMMGVPVVQKRGTCDDWDWPPTDETTILVDDWRDVDAIRARLKDSARIVASADMAYRKAWSLRGQLKRILARLGE